MLKAIGSLIIIVSGLIGGRLMALQYTQRTRELREFFNALQVLETEISYGQTFFPLAIERLIQSSPQPHRRFFSLLTDYLQSNQGMTADQAWLQVIGESSRNFCLKKEDWEVLKQYGRGIGNSDDQNQIRQLKVVQSRLQQLEKRAASEEEKMCKVWNYVGVLTGIALVILLY